MKVLLNPNWKPVNPWNFFWGIAFVLAGVVFGDKALLCFGTVRVTLCVGYWMLINPSQGEKIAYGAASTVIETNTALYLALIYHSIPLSVAGIFFAVLFGLAVWAVWTERHLLKEIKW